MKMRVRGLTVGGSHFGGCKLEGAAIALNTEWKILILHKKCSYGYFMIIYVN